MENQDPSPKSIESASILSACIIAGALILACAWMS